MAVYVITDYTAVKIGMAIDCEKRMAQLQIGNPRVLYLVRKITLGAFQDQAVERALHHHYSRFHIGGEWFEYDILPDIEKKTDAEIIEIVSSNGHVKNGHQRSTKETPYWKLFANVVEELERVGMDTRSDCYG